MATETHNPSQDKKSPNAVQKLESSDAVQTVEKKARPFQEFFTKFNNDWSPNLSAALAYNILMSIFPIALAALSILGFVAGSSFNTGFLQSQLQNVMHVPPDVAKGIADQIKNQLAKSAGVFGIIAIILALYNGSGLFRLIEACFGIIYHVRQRPFIRQLLMSLGMMILFIILIPIMTVTASLPALVISVLRPLLSFPGAGIIFTLVGILGSALVAWIFFQTVYIVVPNQKISFRHSWKGAVFAAIALALYLVLFPLYISRFLNAYAGPLSLVILLIFFYYFALILLLGAEVNAFFSEGITATPTNLVDMVHITTSHQPKSPEDKQKQAAASHKDDPTGDVAKKTHVDDALKKKKKGQHNTEADIAAITTTQEGNTDQKTIHTTKVVDEVPHVQVERPKGPSKVATALEATAGTALAFGVELFRRRRK